MTTQILLHATHHRYGTGGRVRSPSPPVSLGVARTAHSGHLLSMVSPFMRCCTLFSLLLLTILLWPGAVAAGSPDWGAGFYRLNPAKDPAFTSGQNREPAVQPANRDRRSPVEPPQRSETRKPPPREWPEDRNGRDDRSRYDRPWGEVPPEWRNEDLNRRIPEGYARTRPPTRYYDAPEETPWSAPEGTVQDERNTWDYPYAPERNYRRRDLYPAPYYEDRYSDRYSDRYPDERSGEWGYQRRPPPYYYDGGDGWWNAP